MDTSSDSTRNLTELDNPPINWVMLAESYGVPASRAETTEQLEDQLKQAMTLSIVALFD